MKNDHLTTTSNNYKGFFFVLTLCAWLSHESEVIAQPTYQIPVGVRPRSMGEAFVAVADDGNAIRWNPAGLARLEFLQLNFAYAKLFNAGVDNYYASFTSRPYFIPALTDYIGFGFDWHRLQVSEENFSFDQNQFNFALAFKPPSQWPGYLRHLSLGVNGKYFTQSGDLNGNLDNSKQGPGWDLGVLYNLEGLHRKLRGVQFGLMINDVNGTFVRYKPIEIESGLPFPKATHEKILPENLRWGFSYRPFEFWPGNKLPISEPVLAFDVDDRWHVGLEFWLERVVAFRAGWQKDRHTDDGPTLAFGLGLRVPVKNFTTTQLDYAMNDAPSVLDNTNQFGVGLIFKNNPRLLRIEEAHISNVFASLYRHYSLPTAQLGSVKLKNFSKTDTLRAKVAFLASRYMKPQAERAVVIEPERTVDIPLRAVFEPEIQEARERRLTGEVKVTYEYRGVSYPVNAGVDFALYGQNYLTWENPARAAAFVTSEDEAVAKFVQQAARIKFDSTLAPWFTRQDMSTALVLYHALQEAGFYYCPDPVAPYTDLADTASGALLRVDQIRYPAAFLSGQTPCGDCDDLSVLYASALEQAGLPAALISVPGHLFVMFNTRIPARDSLSLALRPSLFIKHNEELWIPIETTALKDSNFAEAWRAGAKKYEDQKSEAEFIEIAAAQVNFPQARPLHSPAYALHLPQTSPRLERGLSALETSKEEYVRDLRLDLQQLAARNRYGVMLAQNNEYELAHAQFDTLTRQDSSFALAWNNWGNLALIHRDFTVAEKRYLTALRHNEYMSETYLNLAILYQIMKSESPRDSSFYQRQTDAMLLQAARLVGGDTLAVFTMLGLAETPQEQLKAAPQWIKNLKKSIRPIQQAIDRAFRQFAREKKIENAIMRAYAVKNASASETERGAFLAWLLK